MADGGHAQMNPCPQRCLVRLEAASQDGAIASIQAKIKHMKRRLEISESRGPFGALVTCFFKLLPEARC